MTVRSDRDYYNLALTVFLRYYFALSIDPAPYETRYALLADEIRTLRLQHRRLGA